VFFFQFYQNVSLLLLLVCYYRYLCIFYWYFTR